MAVTTKNNRASKSTSNTIRAIMRRANKSNFISVEDSPYAVRKLRRIAGSAVKLAAAENRRHGLDAIVIRDNQVIKVDAHNHENVIATLRKGIGKYTRDQVFYARKG
jgi:hypothetical protein